MGEDHELMKEVPLQMTTRQKISLLIVVRLGVPVINTACVRLDQLVVLSKSKDPAYISPFLLVGNFKS